MRGITVRQPWAWAIAECQDWPEVGKQVENRSAGFNTAYRGPVMIHAGLAWSPRGAADERVKELWVHGTTHGVVGDLDQNVFGVGGPTRMFGHGIAVAELVDVHPDAGCCRPWGESEYVGADQQLHRGVTHLVWEDVRKLQGLVPCRGALGLWTVPPEVEEQVLANLAP